MKTIKFIFAISIITLLSCNKDEDSTNDSRSNTRQFGIFKVLTGNTSIEMDGVIGSYSLINFNKLISNYPNIDEINIKNCDGSSDDEVNLQLSAKIYQNKINTHIKNEGLIASGGTDLFLAGRKRTKGSSTKIGVHSWAGENVTATDFNVGHAYHLFYIKYYVSVGFTQQQAEDFYYFTINVATADSIHWMTEAEIVQYNLITK